MSKKPETPEAAEKPEIVRIPVKDMHTMLDPKPLGLGSRYVINDQLLQIVGQDETHFLLIVVDEDDPPAVG